MSFVWVQDVSVGASADAADVNEMQTNLDTIYTALSLTRPGCVSGAGWTEFPITGGLVTEKLSVQAQQLRDVSDYAHDNHCPGYCNNECTGYQNADLVGVDASYCPSYCNDEHTGYQNADLVGVDASYCPGYYNDQHTSYQNADLVGVDVSDLALHMEAFDIGYNLGFLEADLGAVVVAFDLGYDSGYLGKN